MQPVHLDEALQGTILQTLLESAASTSQLAQFARKKLSLVRRELIHLHHMGVIRIVAARSMAGSIPAKSYFQDYVWEITEHGMAHHDSRSGCPACVIRNRRLLRAGGLE